MRSQRRSRVVLPLIVFAVLLLGIEAGVRLRLPPYTSRDFFLTLFGDPPDGTPKNQKPLFEGDPVLFWRLEPNVDRAIWDFTMVSTNAQGLRHARPLEAKPKGRFRIVCVGDSVTFGYRIPLVFPENPDGYDRNDAAYTGRLERLLQAQYPERDIEVVALAVPGYTTYQGRILLEQTIAQLEPDVVVICFGFNDVAQRHFPDKQVMSRDLVPTTLRTILSSSQALLHAWRWWTSRPAPPVQLPQPGPRVSREDYVANVTAMVELARAHGAAVLVVGPVYRDRKTNPPEAQQLGIYRATLRDAMLSQGVPYMQIEELTESASPGNEQFFGEQVHPSSMGHELMAARLRGALRDNGMLEQLGSGRSAS